jgi:hypothetical protein
MLQIIDTLLETIDGQEKELESSKKKATILLEQQSKTEGFAHRSVGKAEAANPSSRREITTLITK